RSRWPPLCNYTDLTAARASGSFWEFPERGGRDESESVRETSSSETPPPEARSVPGPAVSPARLTRRFVCRDGLLKGELQDLRLAVAEHLRGHQFARPLPSECVHKHFRL